jgi:hypothetical protein
MSDDLSPEYAQTLRRMTGEQKLNAAFALYWSARRLKAAALKVQHPDWTEARIERRVSEIFLHGVD